MIYLHAGDLWDKTCSYKQVVPARAGLKRMLKRLTIHREQ